MLKKSLFAAIAILAAVLLAACGDSSKSTDTATEPAAPAAEAAAAVQEGETPTEESDMKITSVKADTNKEKDTDAAKEEETTTPAADTAAPAADAAAPAADAAVPADNTAAPAADAAAPANNTAAPAANAAAQTAAPAGDTFDTSAPTDEEVILGQNAEEEADDADENVGTVSADGDDLNFRGDPSPDGEWLGSIPDGTELVIEEVQDGWGYVEYNGTHGWVSMDYIAQ